MGFLLSVLCTGAGIQGKPSSLELTTSNLTLSVVAGMGSVGVGNKLLSSFLRHTCENAASKRLW